MYQFLPLKGTLMALGIAWSIGARAADLGTVSQDLLAPTALVTQVLVYVCYIVAAIFFFMAMAQYKVHRESPKLVPLSTPIMFVLFGLILGLLPYVSSKFNSGSALEYIKRGDFKEERHKGLALPSLDVPKRKGPGDFRRLPQDDPATDPTPRVPSSRPVAVPPPAEGGHWSDKPQYQ